MLRAPADFAEREPQDAEKGLAEDSARHLGGSFGAFDEDDRDFTEPEPEPPGGVFHLDLESVTLHADGVEVDGFQRTAGVADESGRGVVQGQARDEPGVCRPEIGDHQPRQGPVDDLSALDVARTDDDVVAFGRDLMQELAVNVKTHVVRMMNVLFPCTHHAIGSANR